MTVTQTRQTIFPSTPLFFLFYINVLFIMSETHQETAAVSATINTILYDTLSLKWACSIQLMDNFHEMVRRVLLINIFPALNFLVVSWFCTADADTCREALKWANAVQYLLIKEDGNQ